MGSSPAARSTGTTCCTLPAARDPRRPAATAGPGPRGTPRVRDGGGTGDDGGRARVPRGPGRRSEADGEELWRTESNCGGRTPAARPCQGRYPPRRCRKGLTSDRERGCQRRAAEPGPGRATVACRAGIPRRLVRESRGGACSAPHRGAAGSARDRRRGDPAQPARASAVPTCGGNAAGDIDVRNGRGVVPARSAASGRRRRRRGPRSGRAGRHRDPAALSRPGRSPPGGPPRPTGDPVAPSAGALPRPRGGRTP